jgi:hypothetical protein
MQFIPFHLSLPLSSDCFFFIMSSDCILYMALLDLHSFIVNASKLSISGRSLILREDEN